MAQKSYKISLLFRALFFIGIISLGIGDSTSSFGSPSSGSRSGCLIRIEDRLLLVRDIWSGRYSIPWGRTEGGESIADTAQRAVLDQVGVFVEPVRLLIVTPDRFHLFECHAQEASIPLVGGSQILQPKSAFRSILEVILVRPATVLRGKWQFQSQRNLIKDFFPEVNPQSPQVLNTHFLEPQPWIAMELKGIQKLQAFKNTFLTQFFLFFSFLGGETVFLLMIPFFWIMVNRRLGIEAAFLFCLSILVHAFLKQIFQFYRPFHYLPELKLDHAHGFGFPSGHTLAVLVTWGFIALRFSYPFRWVLAVGMAFLAGLARVYLGVHFFHDIVGGWLLGGVILCSYHFYLKRTKQKEVSLYLWCSIFLYIATATLLVAFQPETLAVVALLAGSLLGIWLSSSHFIKNGFPSRWMDKRIRFVCVILGILVIERASRECFPENVTFAFCLIHNWIKYSLLGIWIGTQGGGRSYLKVSK